MDKIDLEIIALLQKNGRIPFTEIATELDISEGTVRNRVSRLTDNKVLQIVGVADPQNVCCIPYQRGTTGLGFLDGEIEVPASWDVLFNPNPEESLYQRLWDEVKSF